MPGTASRTRSGNLILRAGIALAQLWFGTAHAQNNSLEYAVKATYLYKLAEFVSWPTGALPPDMFVLCVVGAGPFGPMLERAVQGQTVQQRPIVVRRYAVISTNPGCQLIFAAGPDPQAIAGTLAAVRGYPVLTVTDGQKDPAATGIMNFVMVDARVRFEIDQRAAVQNGLEISSKLLRLAVQVTERTNR